MHRRLLAIQRGNAEYERQVQLTQTIVATMQALRGLRLQGYKRCFSRANM